MQPSPSLSAVTPRVLIVEDDPETLALTQQILEKAGYRVQTAGDGAEAVRACEHTVFDAVLMDIQMPVMDGREAAGHIREKGKNRRTPIIAFTALSVPGIREECIERDMDDFLPKPSPPHVLTALIEYWLAQRPLILVADDSRDSRAVLRRLLKDSRSIFVKNGVEALAALRDCRASLVLMDMEMPVMDGYTASRAVSSMLSPGSPPIIAMTSHEGDREVRKCLKAGCADFIQKPVTAASLERIFRKYLRPSGRGCTSGFASGQQARPVAMIDPDLRELIPGYFEQRRNDIASIDDLLDGGDFPEIVRIGHSMKGSGGGYGFPEISSIGGDIESAAKNRDAGKIRRFRNRLEAYLETVSVVYRTG